MTWVIKVPLHFAVSLFVLGVFACAFECFGSRRGAIGPRSTGEAELPLDTETRDVGLKKMNVNGICRYFIRSNIWRNGTAKVRRARYTLGWCIKIENVTIKM